MRNSFWYYYRWFQVKGMTERFFSGLKFSISGFFGVGKFWQLFFDVAWVNVGIFWAVSIFHVISFNDFWKLLWLGNSAWDFFGVKFCWRIFLGFVGSPRDAPIRWSSLSLYIWSTPLRVKYLLKSLQPSCILWGTVIAKKWISGKTREWKKQNKTKKEKGKGKKEENKRRRGGSANWKAIKTNGNARMSASVYLWRHVRVNINLCVTIHTNFFYARNWEKQLKSGGKTLCCRRFGGAVWFLGFLLYEPTVNMGGCMGTSRDPSVRVSSSDQFGSTPGGICVKFSTSHILLWHVLRLKVWYQ